MIRYPHPTHVQFFLLGFRQFPRPGRTAVGGEACAPCSPVATLLLSNCQLLRFIVVCVNPIHDTSAQTQDRFVGRWFTEVNKKGQLVWQVTRCSCLHVRCDITVTAVWCYFTVGFVNIFLQLIKTNILLIMPILPCIKPRWFNFNSFIAKIEKHQLCYLTVRSLSLFRTILCNLTARSE